MQADISCTTMDSLFFFPLLINRTLKDLKSPNMIFFNYLINHNFTLQGGSPHSSGDGSNGDGGGSDGETTGNGNSGKKGAGGSGGSGAGGNLLNYFYSIT